MAIETWLVIDDDVVRNVIVVDPTDMRGVVALRKAHQQVLPATPQPEGTPGIGWIRDQQGRFSKPVFIPELQ